MVEGQRTFACLRFANWDARRLRELRESFGGLRIDDSSTGDDQRILRGTNPFCGTLQETLVAAIARNQPNFLGEKLFREIERFSLDILRERDGDGSGFRRRSEDAHGFGKRGQQLLGTLDTIPVARDGLEAIVDGNILGGRRFELLQHGSDVATRKNIAGEQQYGQTVYGGGRRAGDHVGCARSDGGSADQRAHAETCFRKSRGGMDHGLFVAEQVVAQTGILLERLAEASDVAMAEYSQAACKETELLAVALRVLVLEERDGGLRRGETNRHQAMPLRSDVAPQTCLRHDSRACGKERKGWGAEISWSAPESGPRGGSAVVDKRQRDDRLAAHRKRILRLNSKRL